MLLGFLFLIPLAVIIVGVWKGLPTLTTSNAVVSAKEREQLWFRRTSVTLLAVPGIVVLAFLFLVFWKLFGDGPGLRPYLPYFAKAAILWKITGILGVLCSIRASHLARWSGPDIGLIAVHACSLFFIWIAPFLPYAARAD